MSSVSLQLISGDDDESEVLVEAGKDGQSIIFGFSLNKAATQSLPSRIVVCYHKLPTNDNALESFPDRKAMRESIQGILSIVWSQCANHFSIRDPDVVVQINENEGQIKWDIIHKTSLYNQYVDSLLPPTSVLSKDQLTKKSLSTTLISHKSVVLGGEAAQEL